MNAAVSLDQIARLPAPGDNAAVAVRLLEPGLRVSLPDGTEIGLRQTILEGHRLAAAPIAAGQPLLSWGLPFGRARREILPGDYLCNRRMLEALRERHANFPIPAEPDFEDHFALFKLEESAFRPGPPLPLYAAPGTFNGFARPGNRGVGTRNFIIVVGANSRAAGFVRLVAERCAQAHAQFPNVDGVAAVAHTEGGVESRPNNLEFVLRCLAGFIVHSNVAAALIVDDGLGYVTNERLRAFMREKNYALDQVPHRFWTWSGPMQSALAEAESWVRAQLPAANQFCRQPQPLAGVKIALQCGGSDAFSGISGNPLAGWVAKELARHGGAANLAETDELIGAEPYILSNARDLETAQAFLRQIARFEERVGWHGLSAQTNPSGGNIYRGLYNIALKSLGAARKKDPELRLDSVLDYAEPMRQPGLCFMDSPGNDLEGIAGQVASGCNVILFTTGNGSITNFPFVPTIKIMTNPGRFDLLSHEMDVNAGRYLQGVSMDQLGRESFALLTRVVSGEATAGERAGHAQVQLWRDWRQPDGARLGFFQNRPAPRGQPFRWRQEESAAALSLARLGRDEFFPPPARGQIALVAPTSLCAGQVAAMFARQLERELRAESRAAGRLRRCAALPHTEGCGVSGEEAQFLLQRLLMNYARHPLIGKALLLEHGCEKTHNDAMQNFFREQGVDPARFGWASIQLDGGIDRAFRRVRGWFFDPAAGAAADGVERGNGLGAGIFSQSSAPAALRTAAALAKIILATGGTVVFPQNCARLTELPEVSAHLFAEKISAPSLGYGEAFRAAGLHVMETPTEHPVETLAGLGATGVEIILTFTDRGLLPGLPVVPVVQCLVRGGTSSAQGGGAEDYDLMMDPRTQTEAEMLRELLDKIAGVIGGHSQPRAVQNGHCDFQMTRGWLGVST